MTHRIRLTLLAISILVVAVAAQAGAEVILLSQSRSIHADESFYDSSASLSAPDFGLFEERIELLHDYCEYCDPGHWFLAIQNSEIQTGHFSIHGNTIGSSGETQGYYFLGHAQSDFEVLFEVTVPTPFSLIGTLYRWGSDNGFSTANSSLHLEWNGAPYLSFSSGDDEEEILVSENGILEPGTYTLTVNAMVMVEWADAGASRFDIDFFLETPVATDEMAWGQVKALYR